RRHNDASYRQQVLSQDITAALKLYGEVLEQLRAEFWPESRADLTQLFRQGVEELRLALRDEAFCRQYLPEATPAAIREFAARLRGETVGVGIEVSAEQQRLIVSHLFLNSPAFKAGIALGDRILRIGALPAEQLSVDAAHEKLKGKIGTSVELEVASMSDKP